MGALDAPPLAAAPAVFVAASPATAEQIERKRLAALAKKARLEKEQALQIASAAFTLRATRSYEAAIPCAAAAAVSATPLEGSAAALEAATLAEWGFLDEPAESIASQDSCDFQSCNCDGEDGESSADEPAEAEVGAVPEEWQISYSNSAVGLCAGLSSELLADMIDMQQTGLLVTWPPGVNVDVASDALSQRRRLA